MKFLFWQHSCSSDHRYFLAESNEEYDELIEKYTNHQNGHYEYNDTSDCEMWVASHEQVYINTLIIAVPSTVVCDGMAVYAGRRLRATGVTVKFLGDNSSMDCYDHYIKPGSIEQNEQIQTKVWRL